MNKVVTFDYLTKFDLILDLISVDQTLPIDIRVKTIWQMSEDLDEALGDPEVDQA